MTEPLEDRALSLAFKLKEAQEFDDHGERVSQVVKFRDGINGRCDVIDRVARHREELRLAGLPVPVLKCADEVKELRKRQKSLQRLLLDTEVGALAVDRADAVRLLEVGNTLSNRAKASTAKAWAETCGQLVPASASRDLPAASAPDAVRAALRLAIEEVNVAAGVDAWEEEGAVVRLQEAIRSFSEAWTAFEPYISEVPPSVQAFVDAVRAGAATLSQLTPDVLAWLQDKGEASRYEVRR